MKSALCAKTVRYAVCRLSVRKCSGAGKLQYQMLYQDITDLRLMEDELRQERDRARSYLDIAGVMILALDTEGTVKLINRRGCEILGYEADEIVGKNWLNDFLPEKIREEVLNISPLLLSGKIEPATQYENQVLTKDGQEKTIAWNNAMLRDETGKIIGTLSSGEDITERQEV